MKKKFYDSHFKARVILEVLKGEKTLSEIASEYRVISHNIKSWKRQFLQNFELVFDKERAVARYKEKLKEKEWEMEDLYKQIGKLNTQLTWAQKKSTEAGLEV